MQINLWTTCEIATLYFLKGMNQQDIAKKFNISRMSVSRILQQAKDLNIVEITVKPPFEFNRELETKIINSCKIKSVYVVINKTGEDLRSLLGKVGAFYVCMNLKESDIIGVSVGMTIARLIENIIPRHTSGVKVVQLMGGFGNVKEYEAFDIVQKLSRKLYGDGIYFISAAVVQNKQMKDRMLSNAPLELWQKCNKAILGIGPIKESIYTKTESFSSSEIEIIEKLGGVGDIVGYYFNERGEPIHSIVEDRIVAIPIEIFRNIPEKIAIAGGKEKIQAIWGTLRSGLIDVLITDEETALEMTSFPRTRRGAPGQSLVK